MEIKIVNYSYTHYNIFSILTEEMIGITYCGRRSSSCPCIRHCCCHLLPVLVGPAGVRLVAVFTVAEVFLMVIVLVLRSLLMFD